MAYDLKASLPVYLPRRISKEETEEEYTTSITQNENSMNQNFTEHDNAIMDLIARVAALEGK